MHRVYNCGSVLQAYALQSYVEHMGFHVEIIDYTYPSEFHYKNAASSRWESYHDLRLLLKRILRCRWKAISIQVDREKFYYLSRFLLKLSKYKYTSALDMVVNPPKYDIILIGSDQVWNERFIGADNTFMVPFEKGSSVLVSYASSMPNPSISDEFKVRIATYLSKFNHISVREDCAVSILQDVLGRNIQCVLDPVFLLSAFEWQKSLRFKQSRGGYVLYIPLGYMDREITLEKDLETIKRKSNLKVVGTVKGTLVDVCCGELNPRSFVRTIACADYVVTDSFHVSAFSLIFGIPLIYKSQIKSDTRISNLMEKVGCFDGICYRVDKLKLKVEISASCEYLKNALIDA